VVLVYYAISLIFSQGKLYAAGERGVLLSKFGGDSAHVAQNHTLETLKTRTAEDIDLSILKIRSLDREVSEENSQEVVDQQNAIALIAGRYVPNSVVHYQLYWRGENKVARVTADSFPNINSFVEVFLQHVRSRSNVETVKDSRLREAEGQVARLTDENRRLIESLSAPRRSNSAADTFLALRKRALVVGVAEYQDLRLPRLRFPTSDANAVAEMFKRFAAEVGVEINPTREQVLFELSHFLRERGRGEVVYFYFSGHSAAYTDRGTYLLFSGSRANQAAENGLSLDELIMMIQSSEVAQALLFFDIASPPIVPTVSDSRIAIMFSTAPGRAVWEDTALKNSMFTIYLLKGIQGAAASVDGIVSFDGLFKYISDAMYADTRGSAKPFMIAGTPASGQPVLVSAVPLGVAQTGR
jgi:hypothetical protein